MEYISSDTNVWIDFSMISKLKIPFLLDCTYIMFKDAIEDEIRSPKKLKEELIKLGLEGVTITTSEYYYADELGSRYPRLSTYDRIALAIAKKRNITLLTGDMALRKAAISENVLVIGTIGLLDRLIDEEKIDKVEYLKCISALLEFNGNGVRLPEEELKKRLDESR